MGPRTQAHQAVNATHLQPGSGSNPGPGPGQAPQGGKVLELGLAFAKTVRHFWPKLNLWLNALPDTRFQPMVEYDPRFLYWWGLRLFCCKLGSRRQLDFELRDDQLWVLDNVNRLAGTQQTTLPVNKTLSHFLGHVGCIRRSARAGRRARWAAAPHAQPLSPSRLAGSARQGGRGGGGIVRARARG